MGRLSFITYDFETLSIEAYPNHPPKPVGVSIKYSGEKAHYFAFGHPTENNCTFEEAKSALKAAWDSGLSLVAHNQKFDFDCALTHMGMEPLPWDRLHDTMFLVFMQDPHAASHGLKQSAERILGMPPEERDAVKDWLVQQGIVTKASKNWGAFISQAPGDIVGRYADGDVIRTEKLFNKLWPEMKKRKMLDAYDRERKLMLCLLDMEHQGVDVDVKRLLEDCSHYSIEIAMLTEWCQKQLKAKLNLDSGAELVEALVAAKKVDTNLLGKTPTGAWKTDKASLAASITDATLRAALAHRASLQTCVGTFMQPWLNVAMQTGGKIHTVWNQLKQYGGGGTVGAVTGRMSSTPNLMNIPKEFKPLWKHQEKGLPKCPLQLRDLPLVRSYIIAPEGYALVGRDYSQQELRILAHYEAGQMQEDYLADPWLDIHEHAKQGILENLGKDFERGVVKQINFGLIYGMGVSLMALKAGCSPDEAKAAKQAVLALYPGLRDLQQGLKDLAALEMPLRTWGGRQYYCEPAKEIGGQLRTFEYKMLNVLIQGSAADCTKDAIIEYYRQKPKGHKLLLSVHDELLCLVPSDDFELGMEKLRQSMEYVQFSVPMLSEGKVSATNWAEMVAYDKKGKVIL
jgi:DNA polymerase-1